MSCPLIAHKVIRQRRDEEAEGQNALSSIGWMFFIGDTIHPGTESIFCVISIDLNTPRGFQDIITEQK